MEPRLRYAFFSFTIADGGAAAPFGAAAPSNQATRPAVSIPGGSAHPWGPRTRPDQDRSLFCSRATRIETDPGRPGAGGRRYTASHPSETHTPGSMSLDQSRAEVQQQTQEEAVRAPKRPRDAESRRNAYSAWIEIHRKRLLQKKIDALVVKTVDDLLRTGGSDVKWLVCDGLGRAGKRGAHFSYEDGELEIWSLEHCGVFESEWAPEHVMGSEPVARHELECSVRKWIETLQCCTGDRRIPDKDDE